MKIEAEHARKLTEEKNQIRQAIEEELRKSISGDFENKIHMLQQASIQSDEKLRDARRKELEYLKKEQDLLTKEQELQINIQMAQALARGTSARTRERRKRFTSTAFPTP